MDNMKRVVAQHQRSIDAKHQIKFLKKYLEKKTRVPKILSRFSIAWKLEEKTAEIFMYGGFFSQLELGVQFVNTLYKINLHRK